MVRKTISDLRLSAIYAEVKRKTRAEKDNPNASVFSSVNLREYGYVLDELIARRGTIRKTSRSPVTEKLISMQVGESIVVLEMTQSALTTLRRTARKVLGNDDAKWHAEPHELGKLKITRMKDGSQHLFGKPRNPNVEKLSSMSIGETITIMMPGKIYSRIKVQARLRRGDPTMQWRCTNLANGKIRVERTA